MLRVKSGQKAEGRRQKAEGRRQKGFSPILNIDFGFSQRLKRLKRLN
jgi:hypothetical protein